MILEENVKSRFITLRGTEGIIDSDLAEIYEVRTSDINQAVKNNAKKLVDELYYFETNKSEKKQLIEKHSRLEKLKFSPHNPKFFNRYGIIMLSTILTSDIATQVCHIVVKSFVENHDMNQIEQLLLTTKEQNERLDLHDEHIETLAKEIYKLRTVRENRIPAGFKFPFKEENN